MVHPYVLTRPKSTVSPSRVYLFAVWLVLIVPLMALAVALYKTDQPVVSVKPAQTEPIPTEQIYWSVSQEPAQFVRIAEQNPAFRAASVGGVDAHAWDVLAIAPNNPRVIVIAAGRELLITHDGGNSWIGLSNNLPARMTALAISASSEQVIYAQGDSSQYYVSTDGGLNWRASSD